MAKTPAVYLSSLGLPKPGPVAYASQCFQGKTALGVFGYLDELLGEDVVGISAEPTFPLMHPAQGLPDLLGSLAAFRSSTSGLLQALTSDMVALAYLFELLPAHAGAIAGRGEIDHPQIDAQKVGRWQWRMAWQIDDDQQKPFAIVSEHEIALAVRFCKTLAMVVAHHKGNQDASIQGQEAHAIHAFETHEPLIVWHSSMRAKDRTETLVAFVGPNNARNASHRHLGREAKSSTQVGVVLAVQKDFVGQSLGKRLLSKPRTRRIEALDSPLHSCSLLGTGKELQLQCQFHAWKHIRTYRQFQS